MVCLHSDADWFLCHSIPSSPSYIKKTWELLVVCPTNWGLRIARNSWTDNVRAHAVYINIIRIPHAYIKTNYSLFWRRICSMQAETCSVVNTHLGIYRCNAPDYFLEICEVSVRLGTKRQVNAFSICLNSFSHPKPASERMHPITMDSSFGPA